MSDDSEFRKDVRALLEAITKCRLYPLTAGDAAAATKAVVAADRVARHLGLAVEPVVK